MSIVTDVKPQVKPMTATEQEARRQSRRLFAGETPLNKADPERPIPLPSWAYRMRQEWNDERNALKAQIRALEQSLKEQEKAKAIMAEQQSTALTLTDMTRQVALCPKYADLTPTEHEYVARVAWSMGLNPEFHIHAWKGKRRNKNKQWVETLELMLDYKALILKAKSERRVNINERMLTPDEMRERGIPERAIEEGSIAYVIELYDIADAIMCKEADIPYHPLRGYGWWEAKKDEEKWDNKQDKYVATGKRIDNDVAQGRDGAWMAWKRAIRALFNQIADLAPAMPGMSAEIMNQDTLTLELGETTPPDEDVIEGDYTDAPAEWTRNPAGIKKAEDWLASQGLGDVEANTALGMDNWRDTPLSADDFKAAIESYVAEQAASQ